jgi:hypothetical protein
VVAGGFEFDGAGEERGFEGVSVFDGCAKGACAEGVEVAARGVHDDEAVIGEEAGHEAREGGGEGGPLSFRAMAARNTRAGGSQMGVWFRRSAADPAARPPVGRFRHCLRERSWRGWPSWRVSIADLVSSET